MKISGSQPSGVDANTTQASTLKIERLSGPYSATKLEFEEVKTAALVSETLAELDIQYQTGVVLHMDPNRFPQPVLADLTGDGENEIVVFSSAGNEPPVAALQPGSVPSTGRCP